jgi:hypothetical protein
VKPYGIWNMEYGIWNMEYGIWNMEYAMHKTTRSKVYYEIS